MTGGPPPVRAGRDALLTLRIDALGPDDIARIQRAAEDIGALARAVAAGAGGADSLELIAPAAIGSLWRSGPPVLKALAFAAAAYCRPHCRLPLPNGSLALGRQTRIMGILNCTPDSFSDGGRYLDPQRAVDRALEMIEAGCDIVDIGGQSTQPGAVAVDAGEELRRTQPVIERLASRVKAPLSIDTWRAPVAQAALDAGASIVNDITALHGDPDMAPLVANSGAAVVLMHMQGTPETMQKRPRYRDVAVDVFRFLAERVEAAEAAGIEGRRIAVDPGIGFGKTARHNLELLGSLGAFRSLGCPVLLGASRKSFIGNISGAPVDNRIAGSLATATVAALRGVEIVRVHDVAETAQALRVAEAIARERLEPDRPHVG